MKLGKNKFAAVLAGAALSLGAGQASADVYGLSALAVDNLNILFDATGGAAGAFTFTTDASATLNGAAGAGSGIATCGGMFAVFNTCNGAAPRLSSPVQNAPGGGVIRGQDDFTHFGQVAEYSNAEASIISAFLLLDPTTSTSAIAESNLQTGSIAGASTGVQSNTQLDLSFAVGGEGGSFSIAFDALLDVLTEVNGGDLGLAQANSSLTVTLQKEGSTLVDWAPSGTNTVATCAAGLTCTAVESAFDLNVSRSSSGAANSESGNGQFSLDVTGLTSGSYTLALASTQSTTVLRSPQIPVPGTLILFGTALLLGARSLRRKAA
jgi:hypothetical protein